MLLRGIWLPGGGALAITQACRPSDCYFDCPFLIHPSINPISICLIESYSFLPSKFCQIASELSGSVQCSLYFQNYVSWNYSELLTFSSAHCSLLSEHDRTLGVRLSGSRPNTFGPFYYSSSLFWVSPFRLLHPCAYESVCLSSVCLLSVF